MIQRIQTVYLFLAAALNAALYATPLFARASEDPSRWVSSALLAGMALAALVSLLAIGFFQNRAAQTAWVKRAMAFQLLTAGACLGIVFTLGGFGAFLLDELASMAVPAAALLLQYLALRGIQADEELVRSMDRLR